MQKISLTYGNGFGNGEIKDVTILESTVGHKRNCGFFVSKKRLGVGYPLNKAVRPNKRGRSAFRLSHTQRLFYCEKAVINHNLVTKEKAQ